MGRERGRRTGEREKGGEAKRKEWWKREERDRRKGEIPWWRKEKSQEEGKVR